MSPPCLYVVGCISGFAVQRLLWSVESHSVMEFKSRWLKYPLTSLPSARWMGPRELQSGSRDTKGKVGITRQSDSPAGP